MGGGWGCVKSRQALKPYAGELHTCLRGGRGGDVGA